MEIITTKLNIPILDLVFDKLNKLTFIKQTPTELETNEQFTVSFAIIEDIGINKDIRQLTVRVFYKQEPVYTAATIKTPEQKKILDWFYKKSEKLYLQEEKERKDLEEEGIRLLKKL